MKKEKISEIASVLALFAVGVLLAIFADEILDWISVILGALAIAYSVITLLSYIKMKPKERHESTLLIIVLAAASGIVLISKSGFIREMISFVIGVYIIITSALQLSMILDFRRLTGTKTRSIILPVVGIIIGALRISGDILIPDELTRLTCVFLAIYSVVYLIGIVMISKDEKKAKNHPKIQEGEIIAEKPKK